MSRFGLELSSVVLFSKSFIIYEVDEYLKNLELILKLLNISSVV